MLPFAIILTSIVSLVSLEWLLRNLLVFRVWRNSFHLTDAYESQSDKPLLFLSIVVAAKDEEDNIEKCVRSLLMQDYPEFELIVVNDRSEDRTAEIVEGLAAEDSRLRLMQIETLPDGWCGKNHAMQRGIETTSGEWIFMTDADVYQVSPRSVSTSMRYALDTSADMLSLLPKLEMHTFWENFLLPICAGVLMIWFPPKKVNHRKKPHAFANGQFMMIRREAYKSIGEHEAISASLIEDIDLSRNIKAAGLNMQVAPASGLVTVRMYTSLSQLWRGWIRIFKGSFRTFLNLFNALAVLFGRGLTLFLAACTSWTLYGLGFGPQQWWLACGAISSVGLALQLLMTSRFYHHTESRWWMGLFYPLGCAITGLLLLRTMLALLPGAKIVWRNTSYAAKN